jgi:diaminohydroxyphosphoribosylaminopyrimidine deaminase/5-amino-6-(5-phosphoribosylamino)uracil reductase
MTEAAELQAMQRALVLSRRGPANGPNPRVGCVILDASGRLLAEGWHCGKGTPHAEVDALSRLAHPDLARDATVVVTLEPCNHTGSTGPCSEALIAAGVARVLYAVDDPGRASAGGARRLRDSGIVVERGLLEDAATENILPWLTSVRRGTPFVTVKWASSLDGRAAAADGSSQWITGPAARADVHRRRSEAGAIAVGTGTVLTDDPGLTARADDGSLLREQPHAVVIGRRAVAAEARVRAHPAGVTFYDHHDLGAVLLELGRRDVRHLFVEGGPTLASAFIAEGLVDELLVYLAPTLIGGPRSALTELGVDTIAQQKRLSFTRVERLGEDLLVVARPDRPAPLPSPSAKEL